MRIRSTLAALAVLLTALLSAASSYAQTATAPLLDDPETQVTVSNYRCDAGKTHIKQETFMGMSGRTSTVVAITPESGNIYAVGVVGERAVIYMIKPAGEEKEAEMKGPMWIKHVGEESANYLLHTQGKPNDCKEVE